MSCKTDFVLAVRSLVRRMLLGSIMVSKSNCFVNFAPFTGDNTLTNDTQSINSTELNYFIVLVYSLSYSGCVKSYSETLGEVTINILHSLTS